MADQVERIVLEAEDRSKPGTDSANRNVASVEKQTLSASKAITESTKTASAAVVTITDTSQKHINQLVARTEARLHQLKSPLEKLVAQRTAALSKVSGDPAASGRINDVYGKLIGSELKSSLAKIEAAKIEKAALEKTLEAKRASAIGNLLTSASQNPYAAATQGATQFAGSLGTLGTVAAGAVAVLAGLALASFSLVAASGKAAENTSNLADRLGVTTSQAQLLERESKIAGVEVDAFEGLERKLATTLTAGGVAGLEAVSTLEKLGVTVQAAGGQFKDPIDLIRQLSKHLDELPDHAAKVELLTKIFGRGAEAQLPLIKNFADLEKKATEVGDVLEESAIKRLAEMDDRLDKLGLSYDRLKLKLADKLVVVVEFLESGTPTSKAVSRLLTTSTLPGLAYQVGKDLSTGAGVVSDFAHRNDPLVIGPGVPAPGLSGTGARLQREAVDRGGVLVDQFRSRGGLEAAERQLELLKGQQAAVGARINKGATDSVLKQTIAEFDALDKRILAKKQQIKDLTELPGKEEQAHNLLLTAQAEELQGYGRIAGERKKALEDYGKSAKAIKDINAAFDIRVKIEAKLLDEERTRNQVALSSLALEEQAARASKHSESEGKFIGRTFDIQHGNIGERDAIDLQGLEQQKAAQLQAVEAINAQTLRQKIAVEKAKADIELTYQSQAFDKQREIAERDLNDKLADLELLAGREQISDAFYQQQRLALEEETSLKVQKIREAATAAGESAQREAAIKSAQLIREHNLQIFDSFKSGAERVFDATLEKGGNFFRALGNQFKNTFLTAFRDIVSSRSAAILTQLTTGQKVTLQNDSPGAGPLGRLLGQIGFGAKPVFSGGKLELPGHLGDVALVGGAVPVVIKGLGTGNGGSGGGPGRSGGFFPGLGALAGFGGLVGAGGGSSAGGTAISSSINYGGGPIDLGGSVSQGGGGFGGGFGSLLGLGGNGATPPFLPGGIGGGGLPGGVGGPGSAGSGGVGGFGSLLGMAKSFGGLKSVLNNLGNIGFSRGAGGMIVQGGKAIGGVTGGALLAGGGILAYDGLRRGGLVGLGETIAGGAAIGAKFGGPIGALIGAGVGAVAGTIRLFIKGKAEKIVDKVKAIYGISISKSFAQNPIQQIIDQQYGGNIDVGLRAPEIEDKLRLYAQSSGQPFRLAFKPYDVGLQISGGQLQQSAALVDGSRVAYGGGTAKLAGPVDSLIVGTNAARGGYNQTPQPASLVVQTLQLSLNGQSAANALTGQIAKSPDAVSQAMIQASSNRVNGRDLQISQTTPGLLTR